jgi:hypothetical protein
MDDGSSSPDEDDLAYLGDAVQLAANAPQEHWVTTLWMNGLAGLGFRPRWGYHVVGQYTLSDGTRLTSDLAICVVELVSNINQVILIIECKNHQEEGVKSNKTSSLQKGIARNTRQD